MIKLTVEKFKVERPIQGDNTSGVLRVDGQFNHENGRWLTKRNRGPQTVSRNPDKDKGIMMQLDEMETQMKNFLMDKSDKWHTENDKKEDNGPELPLDYGDADGGSDDEDYQEADSENMNLDQGNAWSNPLEGEAGTGKKTKRP